MQGTVFSSSVRFPVITEDVSIFVNTCSGGLRVIGVVVTKMLLRDNEINAKANPCTDV